MKRDVILLEAVKAYRKTKCVLDIPALSIGQGELVSVLGANGSGKSTLLKVLNGLLPCKEGTLTVLGCDLTGADKVQLRRRSALVFQEPQFIHDTVYANVALPLRFRGLSEQDIQDKVAAALSAFRCHHLSQRLAHRLSGGEAQRVCLARAFVTEPELLLLDEPFSALDPATRNDLLEELKTAAGARNITTILVSHNLEEVLRFAERALVMEQGRIVQDTSPEMVMRRPANLTIARLVGMDNVWPCEVRRIAAGWYLQMDKKITFPAENCNKEGTGYCCLPGDSFRLIPEDAAAHSAGVRIEAAIIQVIPGIGVVQVQARAGEQPVTMRLAADQARGLRPGHKVTVVFDPADAHILMA